MKREMPKAVTDAAGGLARAQAAIASSVSVRFVRGSGWDSKLIEFRTRSWCSHVEAHYQIGDVLADQTAISPGTFGAMLKGGVRHRKLSDPCYDRLSRSEVWRVPCEKWQSTTFWQYLFRQDGLSYDWHAIVAFGAGERDWVREDRWFCSELVMAALQAAHVWKPHGQAHIDRIDPGQAYLLVTSLPGANMGEAT